MIIRTGTRAVRSASCLLCQWRSFSVSYRRLAANKTPTPPPSSSSPLKSSTTPAAKSAAKNDGRLHPDPLGRPIGMNHPPLAGENTGVDTRTIKQRRDDFVDYDKHLARREELKTKMSRPYFRDWRNMQFHKGKTFLSPPRLFKADLSLFFPNLHGRTLASADPADTTPLLEGRASVVAVFSSRWAENQVASFTSKEASPALHAALGGSQGLAQLVQVNVEEDPLKAWLIRLFMGSLRKRVGKENWDKYFIVRKGLTDEIRESIGVLNTKVGYTYLVDHHCRIRWAGSGIAEPGEREGLAKGVQRVLDEMAKEAVGQNFVRRPVAKVDAAGSGGVKGTEGKSV
ncbi:ATP10 protein-domain-containing protein [Bombardia bombarda]|uniref:ATP10 protein-domain-containing protein n=1 Tax=Bombardia bombarda TaxID=252184 RepID=A0AA39X6Y1_9PEZI|nr:ATP10 protein-domain-containing protein [Bombardia bombarda]